MVITTIVFIYLGIGAITRGFVTSWRHKRFAVLPWTDNDTLMCHYFPFMGWPGILIAELFSSKLEAFRYGWRWK